MAFENVKDTKIKTLAETLRKNGLAASDTEAIRMAEEMSGTADRVQQSYENQNVRSNTSTTETRKVVSQIKDEKEVIPEPVVEEPAAEEPEESATEEVASNDVYEAQKETIQSSYGADFDSSKTVQELMDEDAKSVYGDEEVEDDITIVESEEEAIDEELSRPVQEPEQMTEKQTSEVEEDQQPEMFSDDDFETETTKEIKTEKKSEEERKKARDAMAESQIDLSDVFNFNK
ncbi:MAG: hypothetical protein ABH828_00200 [archaeon]